jgi:hypothetical protein
VARDHDGMRLRAHGGRHRRRLRREIRWGISIFAVVLVVEFLVLPRLGGFNRTLAQVAHINVGFVLVGLLLEAAALAAYAELTRAMLPTGGPRRWRIVRIDLSTLALSHLVPSTFGMALRYRMFTQEGVRTADSGFAVAMQGVGSALVLNTIFWLALMVSLFIRPYSPLYTLAAGAGVLLMAVFAAVVVALTRGRQRTVDAARRMAKGLPFIDADRLTEGLQRVAERLRTLVSDRELLRSAIIWATANWLLDAGSLWVFIAAFGVYLSPIDLLVAYGLANILAVIPITPGGLGVVESVLAATLIGFHVPATVAGPAILGYRLVNFWLPIPVGGLAYMSLRFTGEGWRQRFQEVREEVVEHEPVGPPPATDAGQADASPAGGPPRPTSVGPEGGPVLSAQDGAVLPAEDGPVLPAEGGEGSPPAGTRR